VDLCREQDIGIAKAVFRYTENCYSCSGRNIWGSSPAHAQNLA
jgi:hypothetical protein